MVTLSGYPVLVWPALHVRDTFPVRAPSHRHPLPPVDGSPARGGLRGDPTPQTPTVGVPCPGRLHLPVAPFASTVQVPASIRVRVSPSVPKELYTIRRNVLCAGTSEVSQVLNASLSACQALWTPTDPPVSHQDETFVLASSAFKLSPSVLIALTRLYQTSGCAVTLPAYRVPCVRFICFVRCWAPPPHMQHSVRVGG